MAQSNETLRNATTAWARSLNAELADLAKGQYKNFQAALFDPDWASLINDYVASGGDAGDVIEPSDGFHPSQLGNELFADQLWQWLEKDFPVAIGEENPHAAEILSLFPGQGGF